jgi:carboxymethylenebutenolidase
MPHETIAIRTQDGSCPTHVFTPDASGSGDLPAVLFFMDGLGIRPALFEMGERMAAGGYYVMLPDLYYRTGFADGPRLFSDPAIRAEWTKNVLPTVSAENIMRDTTAFIGHLDRQPNVHARQIGATGYCLGGRLSLTAAGHFPDRIIAAASYHGGQLATDAPDSPHRLAPQMKARVYVAGAIEDPGFDDAQKQRLEGALTAAHVDHTIETYNARHGWVPSDTPVHDVAAAEKHWRTLFALLDNTLKS